MTHRHRVVGIYLSSSSVARAVWIPVPLGNSHNCIEDIIYCLEDSAFLSMFMIEMTYLTQITPQYSVKDDCICLSTYHTSSVVASLKIISEYHPFPQVLNFPLNSALYYDLHVFLAGWH